MRVYNPFMPFRIAVNRIAGGECQTTKDVIVQIGECIGMVGHFVGSGQHFLRLIRVLTQCGTNKDSRNIGTHRQQIVDQLRNAFMIKAGQRFKDIQP